MYGARLHVLSKNQIKSNVSLLYIQISGKKKQQQQEQKKNLQKHETRKKMEKSQKPE